MWTLLVLFSLQQIISVCSESTFFRITRAKEEQDSFRLPGSYGSCSRQNKCDRFNANLSSTASDRSHCSCSCSRQKAATFGVKNGYWQCIHNKDIRRRESSDCERIHFISEMDTDLLRVFKVKESAVFNISLNTQSFVKTARFEFSYQACDGGWIPLNNTASARGLQVTKLWTHLANNTYMLELHEANLEPKDFLQGRIIKLAIPRRPLQKKSFCLIFKIAGVMQCLLKHILATGIPFATTKTKTTKVVHSPFSEAVTPTSHVIATKRRKSQKILTATKVPKTTFKTLNEASQVPIPLIAGTAGIAGIVLSVAFFVVLLKCRKGKERHVRKSSLSLELKATKLDDSIDQYSVAEEKAPYQSLSPSPDGVMERGVYVSTYNVPGAIAAINNCRALPGERGPYRSAEKQACDEYDYAESSLVVRKNLFKIDLPVSEEKASNTPEDNVPDYHVLEVREEGLQSEEPSEGTCGRPEESVPCYQVLEGPNPLDPQGSLPKRDEREAHVACKETDPYYYILEGSTDDKEKGPSDGVEACSDYGIKRPTSALDNEEYCGYKVLKSDGRISKDYQALHKYTYVTVEDPTVTITK